jgi:hypothetical protein
MKLNVARQCDSTRTTANAPPRRPGVATRALSIRCVRCASVEPRVCPPARRHLAQARESRGQPAPTSAAATTAPSDFRKEAVVSESLRSAPPDRRSLNPLNNRWRSADPHRSKYNSVVSPMASERAFLAPPNPQSQKYFVDKLWVETVRRTPILFVKQPEAATGRGNSPGDRVATGCKLVASWAKLVIGKGGHR